MPFYYVQVAPLGFPTLRCDVWKPQLRFFMSHVNVGMVATHDLQRSEDLWHPPDKPEIGRRLALWALAERGFVNVAAGPVPLSWAGSGREATVFFSDADLECSDSEDCTPSDFEVADEDGTYAAAARTRIEGSAVIVTCGHCRTVAGVRMGWRALPSINLRNSRGLPAYPFELGHETSCT